MAKTKEEQRRRVLEFKDFNLTKFKVGKNGVMVKHHENFENPSEQTFDGEYAPHPDLENEIGELNLYMASRLGYLYATDRLRDKFKANPEVLEEVMKIHKEILEWMKPSGVQYVGDGDTAGIMITGSVSVPKGGSTGLTVPKITFGKTTLGYESDVEDVCEEIKKEVYAYRFQSKKAQLDIPTEAEKVENPDLFKTPAEQKGDGKES